MATTQFTSSGDSSAVVPLAGRGPPSTLPAGEMLRSYSQMVSLYRDRYKCSAGEAVARADEHAAAADLDQILTSEPSETSWFDLHALAERDPDLAAGRWNEIHEAARDELRSGNRAAGALEINDGPWQRAQFLALRDELASQWRPRTGIEQTLIDILAQAQTAFLFWLDRLTLWSTLEPQTTGAPIRNKGTWDPPRVRDSQAVDQAAAMVDRFNRLFIRTLRALRDLRRYNPTIIVQHASQINLADQQLNIAPPERAVGPATGPGLPAN